MRTNARRCRLLASTLLVALGLGGCGSSDEDEVRAVTQEFQRALTGKDAERACSLLTARGKAHVVGGIGTLVRGPDRTCTSVLKQVEPDDDRPSAADFDKADIAIRGDRAVLSLPGDGDRFGVRKIDGDWRMDNLLNPSLDEPVRRADPRLSTGLAEQQVRATAKAFAAAFADKDYSRVCGLLSPAGEAQILVGGGFAELVDRDAPEEAPRTCEQTFELFENLADGKSSFADSVPRAREIEDADISVRGARATLEIPGLDPQALVRFEGRWLVDADRTGITFDESPSPAALERCWRRAGASIATTASDLRFAAGDRVLGATVRPGRVSAKGADWRIFYAPRDESEVSVARVISDPGAAAAVAYVADAPARTAVVERARACGS